MLLFEKDYVQFNYVPKSHLRVTLTITNPSINQFVYYKFKITKPKFYLLKPDKGTIRPKEQIVIQIALHRDGVSDAFNDKIKCFYSFHDLEIVAEPENFERRSDTKNHKLPIQIHNLPLDFQKPVRSVAQSEVKSVLRSDNNQFGVGSALRSSIKPNSDALTLERQIEKKQQEIVKIKNEMTGMRTALAKTSMNPAQNDNQGSAKQLIVLAVAGFLIGGVSAYFLM